MHTLIAVDFSEESERVISFARQLLDDDDDVTLLNVVNAAVPLSTTMGGLAGYPTTPAFQPLVGDPSVTREATSDDRRSQAEDHLDRAATELDTQHAVTATGDPAERICAEAEERNVDLIIVGTSDPGLLNRIFTGASVSRDVVDQAGCSVLVVR